MWQSYLVWQIPQPEYCIKTSAACTNALSVGVFGPRNHGIVFSNFWSGIYLVSSPASVGINRRELNSIAIVRHHAVQIPFHNAFFALVKRLSWKQCSHCEKEMWMGHVIYYFHFNNCLGGTWRLGLFVAACDPTMFKRWLWIGKTTASESVSICNTS